MFVSFYVLSLHSTFFFSSQRLVLSVMGQVIWFSISCQQEFHFIGYWYHCKGTYIMSFYYNIKISQFLAQLYLFVVMVYMCDEFKQNRSYVGNICSEIQPNKENYPFFPYCFMSTLRYFFEIIWQTGMELSSTGYIQYSQGTTLKYAIQRFDLFCLIA